MANVIVCGFLHQHRLKIVSNLFSLNKSFKNCRTISIENAMIFEVNLNRHGQKRLNIFTFLHLCMVFLVQACQTKNQRSLSCLRPQIFCCENTHLKKTGYVSVSHPVNSANGALKNFQRNHVQKLFYI